MPTVEQACRDKIQHASRAAAQRQLKELVRKGQDPKRLDAYRCPFCHTWHVGHTKPR